MQKLCQYVVGAVSLLHLSSTRWVTIVRIIHRVDSHRVCRLPQTLDELGAQIDLGAVQGPRTR